MLKPVVAISVLTAILVPLNAVAKDSVTPEQRRFILQSAQDGMTEVKLGKIAENKADKAHVKEFGRQMIVDHTKANEALKQVAEKKGVKIPETLDAKHQAVVDKLKAKKGAAFDTHFTKQMVTDHQKVVDSLSANVDNPDADLKKWVNDTLPTVKHHLHMATEMNETVTK